LDLNKATVGEFLSKLEELSKAMQTFRELQALMGGIMPQAPLATPPAAVTHFQPVTNKGYQWSPEEMARRELMRQQREAEDAMAQTARNKASELPEGLVT
jgi:hypothetical protein